jgi:hypothetical protein
MPASFWDAAGELRGAVAGFAVLKFTRAFGMALRRGPGPVKAGA